MQPRRPRSAVIPALVAVLAWSGLMAGCGRAPVAPVRTAGDDVSAADRACRDQWQVLAEQVGNAAGQGVLLSRAFSSQWESVRAGVAYYETTARAIDCGAVLSDEKEKVKTISAVMTKALRYDVENRSARADDERDAWSAKHPQGKEPKRVRAAYLTLRSDRLPAERDIMPAIDRLAAVDPGDQAVVKRTLKDLALLARTSDSFQACRRALAVIHAFHHPAKKNSKK